MRLDLIMTKRLLARMEREQAMRVKTSESLSTADKVMAKAIAAIRANKKRLGLNSNFDDDVPPKVM